MRHASPLKFRRIAGAIYIAGAFGVAFGIYILMFLNGTDPIDYLGRRSEWAFFIILFYLGSIWFACVGAAMLFAVLVIGSPIYVERGRLIYLHPWVWVAEIAAIASVSEQADGGSWPIQGALRIQMRDGEEKWLSTQLISGRTTSIAKILQEFIDRSNPRAGK